MRLFLVNFFAHNYHHTKVSIIFMVNLVITNACLHNVIPQCAALDTLRCLSKTIIAY